MSKKLVTILSIEVVLFVLIVSGAVPREMSFAVAIGLMICALVLSLEDAVLLFVGSIPLFLAIPLTSSFDNFNTWRIMSVVIFIRWLASHQTRAMLREHITLPVRRHIQWYRDHPAITGLCALVVLAMLSLIGSVDLILGAKRIVYFINLSLVGIVLYNLVRHDQRFIERSIRTITFPTIVVIVVGYVQVFSTYLMDIYEFMGIWGGGIQLRQFGATWAYIVYEVGNTWFAYYGDQLSLRVFSLFPDSHSFPQFVLLGIPALLALSLDKLIASGNSVLQMIRTRARLGIVWVPLGFLIVILSGTRGIWAGSLGVVLLAICLMWWLKRHASRYHVRALQYLSLYLVLFFFLFSVAYPIFASPQFLVSKGNFLLFGQRIRSILDFMETSNAQRILIWTYSLKSIVQHPLLGVGIGNFPVVLGQDLFLARAGSSAHNIYLQIAAEMGVPALCIVFLLMGRLFSKTYRAFVTAREPLTYLYYGAALLYVPWVLVYSLTDVALFDERAFLLFVTTVALIAGHES